MSDPSDGAQPKVTTGGSAPTGNSAAPTGRRRHRAAHARSHSYLHWRSHVVLPVNSDIEIARTVVGVPVIVRLRLSYLCLAAVGGALGTAARFGLVAVSPTWQTLSLATVVVNILGPFLLGVAMHSLAQGTESKWKRPLRLLWGVGFLGAFTSYAQLAVDTITVAEHSHILLAAGYAVATIAAGVGAAWAGIATAASWYASAHRRESKAE